MVTTLDNFRKTPLHVLEIHKRLRERQFFEEHVKRRHNKRNLESEKFIRAKTD